MKKDKYQHVIKLPPAIGDWTRIKLPQKSMDEISITQVKDFSFDRVSQNDLKTAHFFHYYFARDWAEKVAKDLNIKVILHRINSVQESYLNFIETTDKKILQIDFFHPELGKFNLYMPSETAEAIINRIFGGKAQIVGKINFTEIEKSALRTFLEENKDIVFKLWPVVKDKDKTVIEIKEIENNIDNTISQKESYIAFGVELAIGEDIQKEIILGYRQDVFKQLLRKKKTIVQKKQRAVFLKENTMNKIKVPLVVKIGSTKISMNDLQKLQSGDVVKLETNIDDPLSVTMGNKVSFLGQPGIVEDKLAIQLIMPEVSKGYKLEKSVVVEKEINLEAPKDELKEEKHDEDFVDDFDNNEDLLKNESIEEKEELEEDILSETQQEDIEEDEADEENDEETKENEDEDDLFGDEDFSWDDIDENEEI